MIVHTWEKRSLTFQELIARGASLRFFGRPSSCYPHCVRLKYGRSPFKVPRIGHFPRLYARTWGEVVPPMWFRVWPLRADSRGYKVLIPLCFPWRKGNSTWFLCTSVIGRYQLVAAFAWGDQASGSWGQIFVKCWFGAQGLFYHTYAESFRS